MGVVGDAGYWLPVDASNSNEVFDSGAETNKCGICSTQVVNRGVLDCCTHWFCFTCIDDWATVTNLCPLCKARFRFITCLPVGYGDPNDPDNIGAGFAKRVDGTADEESNFPFSFPSYFIDEEAVVCLEGEACRVRAGLPSREVEGALAADTSVACDLCDCWYHARCVDFDPEQSSFYCPRCIVSQEKPRNSWQTVESATRISPEARASSLVGSLLAEKELSYGGASLLGGNSVAIAVAEKGESAVSLSMRRIPAPPSVQQIPFTARKESREVMWSPIRESVKAPQNYGPIWSPIREPLKISQNYEVWSPTLGSINQDNDEGLWSPTPESERASGSIFKDPTPKAPPSGSSVSARDYMVQVKTTPENSTSTTAGPLLSKSPSVVKGSAVTSVDIDSRTEVAPKARPFKTTEDFPGPIDTKKDEERLTDGDSAHTTLVEQLKKGKRKVLQEDERKIESKYLPEPPRKVLRTSTKKSDASESRNLIVGKDSSNKCFAEENVGEKLDDHQSIDQSSVVVTKDVAEELPAEEITLEQMEDSKEETSGVCTKPLVDVMDIVSESRNRVISNNQEGVRTRIIMHRETDASDTVGAGLVDRIRQQMRTTAGYTGGEDFSKVEVSDDRFLAAFKAALLSSRQKSKETKLSAPKAGKSLWLDKVLSRKSQGKGSRDSLTRKLYAGGTGRWDRDWDIAFWKERSTNLRKAQKEADDEIKSLGITEKHAKGNAQPEEEDSIFSRIYIADTSLFPRNEDVQLLSEQVKNSADGSVQKSANSPRLSPDKRSNQGNVPKNNAKSQAPNILSVWSNGRGNRVGSTPSCQDVSAQGSVGVNGKANVGLGVGKLSASPKLSTKSGSVQPQVSASSVTLSNESTSGDMKKDKRQWALEVLARKTGSSSKGSSSTQTGSAKATGCADTREGQFGLLLQLPIELRPLLEHNRHSKVPTAVRQVQLNRIVEQELRNAQLTVIQKSRECEEAVNQAKAREEELYRKSNSKGVYVNLCVRSLAQSQTAAKAKPKPELDHSDAIQTALEAAGLVESPPASPSHGQDDVGLRSTTEEAPVCGQDSGDQRKDSWEEKWVDDVLEVGNPDIYGDLDLTLSKDLEDPVFAESSLSSKTEAAVKAAQDSNGETKKMTVLLSTVSGAALEPTRALPVTTLETPLLKASTHDSVTKADPPPTPKAPFQARPRNEEGDKVHNELEGQLTAAPTSTGTTVTPKNRSAHVVSPTIPPSEQSPHSSQPNVYLKSSTTTSEEGREKTIQNRSDVKKPQSPTPPAIQNMDDWMNSGKFADLDRRIENIRQSTSPSINGEVDVPWNSSRTSVESLVQNELLTPQQCVQKQVEIYVNQHLKPLYRSGVINSDQFRYTVSKTAAKVMEHHENATSADFLIVEGTKVKKLADQYLQNFTKRKVK